MMTFKHALLLAVALTTFGMGSLQAAPYGERVDVQAYIEELVAEHDLSRRKLKKLFNNIEPDQVVLEAIARPAEKTLTWAQYRPIFMKEKRIEQGKQFMIDHADTLARAEATYGVPASIITAIIGVETFYGRITGKFEVASAVASLAFDYPPRSKFFKKELTEFLILASEEGWDASKVKGSYAGAMGWPQFISSSYRRYSVDFDGDGKRDLLGNVDDAIGSVANYFSVHGWKTGELVAENWVASKQEAANVSKLVTESLKPSVKPEDLKKQGFSADSDELLSVMQFEGANGQETWIGYPNFYVITRYNHSRMYALAVYQLSRALQ